MILSAYLVLQGPRKSHEHLHVIAAHKSWLLLVSPWLPHCAKSLGLQKQYGQVKPLLSSPVSACLGMRLLGDKTVVLIDLSERHNNPIMRHSYILYEDNKARVLSGEQLVDGWMESSVRST